MQTSFKPNRMTFDQGVDRLNTALKDHRLDYKSRIVTSRDPDFAKVSESLRVTNVPEGFAKWQLPIMLDGPSQMYVTVANPNATVPTHSHDEGDGLRWIISGSIIYEGKELTAGDWMFVPRGKPYSFLVGDKGAVMAYCYQCCCA